MRRSAAVELADMFGLLLRHSPFLLLIYFYFSFVNVPFVMVEMWEFNFDQIATPEILRRSITFLLSSTNDGHFPARLQNNL